MLLAERGRRKSPPKRLDITHCAASLGTGFCSLSLTRLLRWFTLCALADVRLLHGVPAKVRLGGGLDVLYRHV